MPYIGNQAVVGDSANTFKLLDDIASFTVTFDATDSGVVSIANNTLTFNNHRFVTAQKVTYNDGGGTAIGGLSDGSYFIIKVDQNTIKLASSASNAASGTAIDLTSGAAGGSHTLKIAFDGINTKFKATHTNGTKAKISRAAQLSLSINGVIQQPQNTSSPTVGYGIEADSTIVFSTAPAATDKVFGSFIGEVAASFDIEDNTIDNFTGDGSTTIFNLSKEVPSSQDVLVTLDGVTQHPSDGSTTRSYSVINQALTFVSAPDTGVAIQARHIGFAGATTSAVTGFYGRTGNAALTSTDDISVQNISGVGATFTGNVNIEGVLTYEDVTNVDSIGIITARAGVLVGSGITLSKDGDVFFTGIATGNGSGLTALNASNISSGTVPTARLGSGTASSSTFLRGDSTFQTVNTDLVSDTSPQLGGNLDVNTKNIVFGDSSDGSSDDVLTFGAGTDIKIYSDGSNGYITHTDSGGDPLYISSQNDIRLRVDNTDEGIKIKSNGAVELYHNNVKTFETSTGGATLQAAEGGSAYLYMSSDEGDDNGDKWQLKIDNGDQAFMIKNYASGSWETSIECNGNGNVELYHDNSIRLATTSAGIDVTGSIDLPDNGKLLIGDGDDLQIDHSGTNSQIYHNGTGNLYIATLGTGEDIHHQSTGKMTFTTGGSERLRITDDGIKFNGDNAAANALDDYEEGTYTPVVGAAGWNATSGEADGTYIKVGDIVTVHIRYESSSFSSVGMSDALYVTLPFTSKSGGNTKGTLMCSEWSIGSQSISWIGADVRQNTDNALFHYHNGNNNNTNNLTKTSANNQLNFKGTVVYQTA